MNKKILSVLALASLMSMTTACGGNNNSSSQEASSSETPVASSEASSSSSSSSSVYTPDLSKKVTLKLSVNYDKSTGMKYTGDKTYVTPSGTEIKTGSWKPVYAALQDRLNFTIDDVTSTSDKAVNVFKSDWKTNQFADMACGNVSDIVDYSVAEGGETILDISKYLNKMPNFKQFLIDNPTVQMSITTGKNGDATKNAIYYLPYFDGYADLEKMTLLRADLVRKLLDADNVEWDTDASILGTLAYQPTVTDNAYEVTVPKSLDSNETKKITKANVTNIIAQQNALSADQRTAAVMVPQFRKYISDKYGTQFAKKSDLFLGVDACYDADEMIALMRIARVAPKALNGDATKEVIPFVPREYNNSRCEDLFRWAGHLFGVRGVESRCGYLYLTSENGKTVVHDARGDAALAGMIENVNKLYAEGLILQNYTNKSGYGVTDGKYAQNLVVGNANYVGFMEYDYAQSQGAWNDKAGSKAIEGYDFRPIINGVAKWDDGDSSTNYFAFTESWRSVKTQAWCLNAALANDEDKLNRALAVADFFYSAEGHDLNSFGPESEGYTQGTFNYQGKTVKKFTDAALAQLNNSDIGGGSYTNYLRKFVGATLPIGYIKEQGMEYQCTTENAKNGLTIINKAIELGTFKHVEVNTQDNSFYTIVPSAFNLSAGAVATKTELENKQKLGSINSNSSTDAWNIWNDYVIYGFGAIKGTTTLETKAQYLEKVNTTWTLPQLVKLYQDAYTAMVA